MIPNFKGINIKVSQTVFLFFDKQRLNPRPCVSQVKFSTTELMSLIKFFLVSITDLNTEIFKNTFQK